MGIAFLGFRLLSRDDEPNPTATPTPTATQEVAAPTDTPEPVAAVPTATPTLSPTQTPAPPQEEEEGHQVGDITLGQPPAELRIGDSWTLTATVENTGDIGFEMVDYDLLGNWEAILELPQPPRIDPTPLQPQETRTVEFVFRAIQEGQAEIRLLVTVLVNEIPPSKELIEAEPIQVTIVP